MWEHFVLNELMTRMQSRDIAYWRDKRGHEVDFVLARRGKKPLTIECKWSADNFDPTNVRAFRQQHPEGENVVVAQDIARAFSRTFGELRFHFETLDTFADSVAEGRAINAMEEIPFKFLSSSPK
jgi:hypothetical protein